MEHTTHNNTVQTDELLPGCVMFDCEAWGVPDNTIGKVNLHVCYRPLCGDMYKGNELVNDAMKQAVREHYESRNAAEEASRKAEHEAFMASLQNERTPSPMDKAICPKCGTVCYGDCEA